MTARTEMARVPISCGAQAEDTEAQEVTHVNLVTNWFDEVRRRVASAGQN